MAVKKGIALYVGELEELRLGDSFSIPWGWLTSLPTTLAGYGITDALPLSGGTLTDFLTLHADPASALQAATKQYVDGLAANLGKRARVRAATTANVTISTALNNGDVLDGVSLASGDLVLVKDQATPAQNGVYVVGPSPARAPEFDTFNEHPGSLIAIAEGTSNGDTLWLCTSNDGGTLNTTAISFSQVRFNAASDTISGNVELATTTEALTGTDAARAMTPDALAALWEKGADIASAGTISLGEGGFFHITGTTTIIDIDWATAKDGRPACMIFDGALTLTHNPTTLKLPGNANIVTAAGDRAIFIQDSSDNVICIAYIRAASRAAVMTDITQVPQNAQTGTTYTFVAGDAGKMVSFNNASAITATVNNSVHAAGDRVDLVQLGAGQVTLAAGAGMTIRSSGGKLKLTGQYSGATLWFSSASECVLIGDIAT